MHKQFFIFLLFCNFTYSTEQSANPIEPKIFSLICHKEEEEEIITFMDKNPGYDPHYSDIIPEHTLSITERADDYKNTLLGVAIHFDYLKVGEKIVEKDLSTTVCAKSIFNGHNTKVLVSALVLATKLKRHAFIRMLLNHKVNIKDPEALVGACNNEDALAVKILLEAGANPDQEISIVVSDCKGQHDLCTLNPLFTTVKTNSFLCMQLLLRFGADPDIPCKGLGDSKGYLIYPLYKACQCKKKYKLVEALLNAGADPKKGVIDNYKQMLHTPIDQARRQKNVLAIDVLCNHLPENEHEGKDPTENLPTINPWVSILDTDHGSF